MMQALTLTLTLCPVILTFTLTLTRCMMRKLHIDDPLDAFAVHGACGVWGVLATGLFTAKEYSYAPHADSDLYKEIGGYDSGLFMTGTHGSLFATHVVSIIIEVAWVVTMSAIMFGLLKAANIFRVPPVRRRRHIVVADAPPPHSRLRPPPPPHPFSINAPMSTLCLGRAQEDEDIGLDNSKHGGSAYTHDMQMTPNEMNAYNVAMTDGSKAEASPRI
jgi:hypothetical protein